METRKIKELLPKPSDLIDAMIQGLREQSARPDFKVDMDTWGNTSAERMCFGCAAICTMQKAFGVTFKPFQLDTLASRSSCLAVEKNELDEFEMTVDGLRRGNDLGMEILADYYKATLPQPTVDLPPLNTGDWSLGLPAYETYRDQLKAIGL